MRNESSATEHLPPLNTAVLFLVFNRLDTTTQVFESIRLAKPPRLYIASDGARTLREGEKITVQAIRDYVLSHIDWECEVKTLFRESNFGCKYAVSGAIDWFFENEEMGIILEDDCLPNPSFFRFCEELLEQYRVDERIAMISGDNFQLEQKRTDASYYFSRYNHIWGWASWRRAWQHYDPNANAWPEMRDGKWLEVLFKDHNEQRYWTGVMQAVHDGKIDTWDYQWGLASWSQNMISILPNVNLISNIGFGADATHSRSGSIYADLPTESLRFPIRHPKVILPHAEADAFTAKGMHQSSKTRRILMTIKSLLR